MNTTRYFLYARKSTDDASRQIRSIDDQIAELREIARRDDLAIQHTFIEKQTAKCPGRPVFNEMLDRVERGEAQGILAWHPDRLARNLMDGGRISYLVDVGKILDLRFPTFRFEPTAQGKFMLTVMFGQSKYYIDNLSENIKRGHRQKLKNGIIPAFAPIGYRNDTATRTVVQDPHKAPLVRRAFELYASGDYTLRQLRDAVNAEGLIGRRGMEMAIKNYHDLLRNPVYYGLIRFNGELYEGKHEPIVTKALFDRCQEVLTRKSKPKGTGLKPYLYRGLFHCGECGCFITTETQKGHNYVHCTKRVKKCAQPFVREERIAEQIGEALKSVMLPRDWTDWMIGQLQAEQRQEAAATADEIAAIQFKQRELAAGIDRLTTAYAEGAISLAEFRETKSRLVDRKQVLKEQQARVEANRAGRFEPAIAFVRHLQEMTSRIPSAGDEEKRDFLKKVGSNLTLRDRRLFWQPRGAWQAVVNHGPYAKDSAAHELCAAGSVGENENLGKETETMGRRSNVLRRESGVGMTQFRIGERGRNDRTKVGECLLGKRSCAKMGVFAMGAAPIVLRSHLPRSLCFLLSPASLLSRWLGRCFLDRLFPQYLPTTQVIKGSRPDTYYPILSVLYRSLGRVGGME